jgi:hypothetical protein
MSEENTGHFKIKDIISFEDIVSGKKSTIQESDLCFQNETHILQFEHKSADEEKKTKIKPGSYDIIETPFGLSVSKREFRVHNLLEEIDNTSKILKEATLFFNRLHIYDQLERIKKRGVLLYSAPGMGKSSAISKFCRDFIKEDAGTVVLNWPTSEIECDRVSRFLSTYIEYTDECTRLILIIEDIGGGEHNYNGGNAAPSGLLNLLDGVGVTFKLPTFIVATTNHPENLLESLANRPGRFDLMMELEPPSLEERIKLCEFISKRELTQEEKDALDKPDVEKFSIAHMEEIIVRSMLHDKSIPDVIDELVEHYKKFKKSFEEEKTMGIGL